jgi:hypothetical protein
MQLDLIAIAQCSSKRVNKKNLKKKKKKICFFFSSKGKYNKFKRTQSVQQNRNSGTQNFNGNRMSHQKVIQ